MQSFVRSRQIPLALGLLLVLLVAQQVLDLPGSNMLALAIKNSLHSAWFFVVTLLLWFVLYRVTGHQARRAHLYCGLLCLLIAPLTEFVQFFTHRDASFSDLLLNLLGSLAALSLAQAWLADRAGQRRRALAGLALAAAFLLAGFHQVWFSLWYYQARAAQAPVLVDFSTLPLPQREQIRGRWTLRDAPDAWVARAGAQVALVSLPSSRRYPGITLREPLPGWENWCQLVLEAYLGEARPLLLTLRVETERDRGMDSTVQVLLEPGANRISIPLVDLIAAPDALPSVRNLLIFASDLQDEREFYLASVRLD